jgi:hypothetical protein
MKPQIYLPKYAQNSFWHIHCIGAKVKNFLRLNHESIYLRKTTSDLEIPKTIMNYEDLFLLVLHRVVPPHFLSFILDTLKIV